MKTFYTLEGVWVRMKIRSNWKWISVDCKIESLTHENQLHLYFTFKWFPDSQTPEERERERARREYKERRHGSRPSKKTHPHWTHTQRKKTHPSSWAGRGYFADPSLILTDTSHSADPFLIVTNPVNDPLLSQSNRHEQPIPEPICPSCEQPTSRSDHPMSDPLLDQATTFRLTHCVHVATTVATTTSPTNRSLSLSLCHWSPSLTIGLGIFDFFCFDFCFFDCLYILILCNNICLDHKKMWETW